MKEIVIATNNQGKINDFKVIFPDYHVIGISELIPDFDVEETGVTFEENAKLKSEAAAKALNKTVIADDSGLEVFALNGEPGIYSARYAGENKSDEANIEKLLNKLGNTTDRRAQFVCVISMSGLIWKLRYLKVRFQVKLQMENMVKMVSDMIRYFMYRN